MVINRLIYDFNVSYENQTGYIFTQSACFKHAD